MPEKVTPVQVPPVVSGVATIRFAGRLSVNCIPDSATVLLFVSVKVNAVGTPMATGFVAKDLVIEGGVRISSVAFVPAVFGPAGVVTRSPAAIVLLYDPGVRLETCIESVQVPGVTLTGGFAETTTPAGIVPPVKVIEFAVCPGVPPMQVVAAAPVVVRPAGIVSVNVPEIVRG